jgi:hypothetical protein
MSQENVELAYRAFDAFARHDLDVFVAFHDRIARSSHCSPLSVATITDTTACGSGGRTSLAFPDFSFRVDQVRELGDRTLGAARISAHGAHGMDSAAPMIEQVSWILAEWLDERVVWWCTCRSEAEALEAAGLRE